MIRTPLYNAWINMRQRCVNSFNPKYSRYGGRGIIVCDEWNNFKAFENWSLSNGYKPGLTLNRRDNNGDYTPNNCEWTTFKAQSNNTRRNVRLTVDGETKTVIQWAEDRRCLVDAQTIYKRLNNGWVARDAVLQPLYRRAG